MVAHVRVPADHRAVEPAPARVGPSTGEPQAGVPDHEGKQSPAPEAFGTTGADARRIDHHADQQYAVVLRRVRDRLLERRAGAGGLQNGLPRS